MAIRSTIVIRKMSVTVGNNQPNAEKLVCHTFGGGGLLGPVRNTELCDFIREEGKWPSDYEIYNDAHQEFFIPSSTTLSYDKAKSGQLHGIASQPRNVIRDNMAFSFCDSSFGNSLQTKH